MVGGNKIKRPNPLKARCCHGVPKVLLDLILWSPTQFPICPLCCFHHIVKNMVIPLWSWWQRLVWATRGPWLFRPVLYHYYSLSCQRHTDAVMIMTVKTLSCWLNSGWSHLQSAEEDVSLLSVWFCVHEVWLMRGVRRRKLPQRPSSLVEMAQCEECECTDLISNSGFIVSAW